ncbi:polyprenyl synthetase family protein [Pseudovibrio exalbescens]|uniref:polyprenyl synthetase family protein n=1 Tax=Pseudovibrio exalbescens TaxID=197461 RepID=UPI00236590DA|nr:polyprenyl synthetase family protein [Pseudovibrio exalbescens]MDD7911491.1 polyprenyl synthetase family protein [Pseudovibrio exalbescens]
MTNDNLFVLTENAVCAAAGENGLVSEACHYHLAAGGGRFRAKLGIHAGERFALSPTTIVALAASCELLHNASLIHDDLQDGDKYRRGQQSVWARYGADTAICAGDYLLSASYKCLANAQTNQLGKLISHLHDRTAVVIEGQAQDLQSDALPRTSTAYRRTAEAKSGPLLALPLELAALAAGQEALIEPIRSATTLFALGYQMADDLSDAAKDFKAGAHNVIWMFEPETDFQRAVIEAAHLTRTVLQEAKEACSALPFDLGSLMVRHADKMLAQLPAQEAA